MVVGPNLVFYFGTNQALDSDWDQAKQYLVKLGRIGTKYSNQCEESVDEVFSLMHYQNTHGITDILVRANWVRPVEQT